MPKEELEEQIVMEPSPALQGRESSFAVIKEIAKEHRQKQLAFIFGFCCLVFALCTVVFSQYLQSKEKVIFALDGAGTVHTGIQEVLEADNSIFNRLGMDAAIGAFERTPNGYRFPEYMDFYFSASARNKMERDWKSESESFRRKGIKQEANPIRVKFLKVQTDKGQKAYTVGVVIELERRFLVSNQLVTESETIQFLIYAVPNPKLSERAQFPFVVDDFIIERNS